MKRRLGLLAASATLAVAQAAYARVGGGGGYSGGGDSGGDGDIGLIIGLLRFILWLVFRHPYLGIPLLIVLIIVVSRWAKSGGLRIGVHERPTIHPARVAGPAHRGPVNLTPVRATDPFFSEPVFLDFAQLVYARAHEMRGAGRREPLTPWMDDATIDKLLADRAGLESVSDVIFGATRIVSASTEAGFVKLEVAFETNMTETRNGARGQILADERWAFRRKAGVRSPAPDRMRALGCPSCGSTLEPKADGTCASCGVPRRGGATQWEVGAIVHASRRALTAPELSMDDGSGVETGTDRPTVTDPRLPSARRTLESKYPDHAWPAFDARVREVFLALQDAWSTGEWERARAFETDALFQAHRFWVERYAAFGLRNRVEEVTISRLMVVKIDADAFYDAITVRIYASALDWTEDAQGKVVGGNPRRAKKFSEYWTFLRAVPGSAAAPDTCPSCAAALPPGGGATVCASCGSKLTGGAFDWVASRIEQDDAYAG